MSKKETDVQLIPDSTSPYGWKVKHGLLEGNGPGNYPKVKFSKDSGPHLLVFKIDKDSPAKFNANDPIWIHEGTGSPTKSGIDAQFPDWALFDGAKTLVLLDLNSKGADYAYRVKADNYGPVLDPVITNGGGTIEPPAPPGFQPPGGAYDQMQFFGAAAIMLVVGLLLGRYVIPKRTG